MFQRKISYSFLSSSFTHTHTHRREDFQSQGIKLATDQYDPRLIIFRVDHWTIQDPRTKFQLRPSTIFLQLQFVLFLFFTICASCRSTLKEGAWATVLFAFEIITFLIVLGGQTNARLFTLDQPRLCCRLFFLF